MIRRRKRKTKQDTLGNEYSIRRSSCTLGLSFYKTI
jgi:hypothetical protein